MNPLQLLTDTESSPDLQPACGARICEDYMRVARLIQSSLIPSEPFRDNSAEIAFRFTPFFDVGSDFVDFFRLPNGVIGLYLGDVVGKGLPATMYGALVMGTLRGIQIRDRYRHRPFAFEPASDAASASRPLLLDVVRGL